MNFFSWKFLATLISIGVLTYVIFRFFLKKNKKKNFPLLPTQTGMYYEMKISDNKQKYNISFGLELNGTRISEKKMRNVIYSVPSYINMPARIIEKNGEVFQQYSDIASEILFYEFKDFSSKENTQIERELNKIISTEFIINKGPLLNIYFIKKSSDKYLLLVLCHHLVSDGISAIILSNIISSLYRRPLWSRIMLFGMSFFYANSPEEYVRFRKNNYSNKKFRSDESYWIKELKGSEFHFDFKVFKGERKEVKKTKVSNVKRGNIVFSLDDNSSKKMFLFAKETKTTTFEVLSSLFGGFLYRLFGQNDMIISYPCNIRPSKYKLFITNMVNNMLLRIKIDESMSMSDLVKSVSARRKEDKKRKNYPYFCLVDSLRKNYSFNPGSVNISIAQTFFTVSGINFGKNVTVGEELAVSQVGEGSTDFSFMYQVIRKTKRVIISFVYNKSLFETELMQRIQKSFLIFIQSVFSNPTRKIVNLSVLGKKERELQLHKWNETKMEFPEITKRKSIRSIFEALVKLYPKEIAVEFMNEKITYEELNKRANEVAHYLREEGVKNQEFVGICIEKSIPLIVHIIAVFKIGAIYFPLDSKLPMVRLKLMLSDTKCKFLFVNNSVEKSFDFYKKGKVIRIENVKYNEYGSSNLNLPESYFDLDNLAYIIYTSGSTGRNKGVPIRNRSILNGVFSQKEILKDVSISKYALFGSIVYDSSIQNILVPLFTPKCTLVIVQEGIRKDIEKLIEFINSKKLECIGLPTALLKMLPRTKISPIPCLKVLRTGGDVCSIDAMSYWSKKVILQNLYGPTECTVISHGIKWKPHNIRTNIGKPIYNFSHYVLNEHLQLLPIGLTGMLYIGGIGQSKGYLNLPKKTKEAFIPHPFKKNETVYKTGDLVRFTKTGDVIFIGRRDNQVKVRGFRIELGEIESKMRLLRDVISDAVCVVVKNQLSNKVILAFVVLQKSKVVNLTFTIKEILKKNIIKIKEYLNKELPNHMVPSVFHFLKKFPTNVSGKIDRKELIKMGKNLMKLEKLPQLSIPKTETEKEIAKIFSSILNLGDKKFSIYQNYFEMGGNSLSSAMLVRKISNKFKILLNLKDFLSNPTISHLSKIVDSHKRSKNLINKFVSFEKEEEKMKKLMKSFENVKKKKVKENPTFFFTGATGFLGEDLLLSMVKTFPKSKFFCLVRSSSKENFQKLINRFVSLKKCYKVLDSDVANISIAKQIIIVEGDLSLKRFGLSKDKFLELTKEVDSILHNGCYVNHFLDYNNLYDANVGSFYDIVRISEGYKPIYFVSTISVYDSIKRSVKILPKIKNLSIKKGYIATKYIVDYLIHHYCENYLVFRPSFIVGNTITGKINPKDWFNPLIDALLKFKIFPNVSLTYDFVPVEYVSYAISKIIKLKKNQKIFNINYNSKFNSSSLKEIITMLEAISKEKFKVLSWDKFVDEFSKRVTEAGHPFMVFLGNLRVKKESIKIKRDTFLYEIFMYDEKYPFSVPDKLSLPTLKKFVLAYNN